MPLTSLICDYSERPVPFKGCLKCSASGKNPCAFTYALIKGILDEQQDRGDSISCTALLSPTRCVYLERRVDYAAKPSQLYWSFRGQIAHKIVEGAGEDENVLRERREYRRTIEGIEVSGKFDELLLKQGILRDYKTCKKVPRYDTPYSNHSEQLNVLRWILAEPDDEFFVDDFVDSLFERDDPVDVKQLECIYLDMEQPKKCQAKMWSLDKAEEFVQVRAKALREAFDTGVCPPYSTITKDDLWKCAGFCQTVQACHELHVEELREEVRKCEAQ